MAEILFTRDNEFQAIVVDATIEEQHSDTADVTDHPVEEGSDASDGLQNKPPALTLTVFVTNTPIISPNVDGANGSIGTQEIQGGSSAFSQTAQGKKKATIDTKTIRRNVNVLSVPDPVTRVETVYANLLRLKEEATILLIVTSLREYDSMVITEITAPRNAKAGGSVSIVLGLRYFRIVSTETVETPEPLETRAEAERRRGASGTTEDESTERRSFAAALVEDYGGIDLLH